jgi:hypothetical protein
MSQIIRIPFDDQEIGQGFNFDSIDLGASAPALSVFRTRQRRGLGLEIGD